MRSTQATINELIAGSAGGAAQVLVGQPLDTIKTRAQIASSEYDLLVPGMIITDSGTVWLHRGHVCEPTPASYVAFLLLVLIRSGLERSDGYSCANAAEGGFFRFIQRCSINLFWPRFVLTFVGLLRDGKPAHRHRWCQLAPLRLVWIIQAHDIAISPAVAEGDRSGWCYGRNCQRRPC